MYATIMTERTAIEVLGLLELGGTALTHIREKTFIKRYGFKEVCSVSGLIIFKNPLLELQRKQISFSELKGCSWCPVALSWLKGEVQANETSRRKGILRRERTPS